MGKVFAFLEDDIFSLHAREEIFFYDLKENLISFSRLKHPGISIAKHQNYRDVLEERASQDGVAVTRRKTGGRFMYLDNNDLVISFALQTKGSLQEDYALICKLLVESLQEVTGERFQIDYVNDILHAAGRKIGGAAQQRDSFGEGGRSMVHAYLRYAVDPEQLFKYCALDGHPLVQYVDLLKDHVTCIRDFSDISFQKFFDMFCGALIQRIERVTQDKFHREDFSSYSQTLEEKRERYQDPVYISGSPEYQSRGHCDAIAGSGSASFLKIPALAGKVRYG